MLAGEKDCATVGADGVTFNSAGQAVALLPADVGAVLLAELAVAKVTVSVSTLPAESVTVSVRIPPAEGFTVTCGVEAPPTMMLAGVAAH